MSNNATETVALSDLNPERVRAENDYVDEMLDSLESEVADLRSENETLKEQVSGFDQEGALEEQATEYESRIDELEAELETKNDIIQDIRENQKAELLDELRESKSIATGTPVGEVDVSEFEEASQETIESTIETLDEVAQTTSRGQVESTEEDIDPQAGSATKNTASEADKKRVAKEMGVNGLLEDAEDLAPQGFTTNGDR